jgi:type IV pilus assembly protein PilB
MSAPITDLERAVALLTVEYKLLTPERALAIIESTDKRPIVDRLLDEVPEQALLKAIAQGLGIRFYDLYSTTAEFQVNEEVLAKCDINMLKRFQALPLTGADGRIVVAVANPSDPEMVDYLRARYKQFALVLAPRTQLQNRLAYHSASEHAISGLSTLQAERVVQPTTSVREITLGRSPMQEWVENTLARAVAEGASDVHMMMNADKTLLLRFRIDGILNSQRVPAGIRPLEAVGAIVARCETMDSANYKEPQDGTFSFDVVDRQIDARVAMMPQLHGPTLVIRLLDSSNMTGRLEDMGFSAENLVRIREVMGLSQGTALAVGPTGAGKSTTLYAMLREVDARVKHVQTVENPVEYRVPLIGQTEIRPGLGDRSITFGRALRTILRMDPDVILVGEIRDTETAEVAMQAAITGHLVLSTLHANSAVAAFPRLINMGVPPYLTAEAVNLLISQRLLRRIHECCRFTPPTTEEVAALLSLGLDVPDRVPQPVGCPACRGTGYRGRVAAAEVLSVDREIRDQVARSASADTLSTLLKERDFVDIRQDGLRHVREGRTTVSEILRVLSYESGE